MTWKLEGTIMNILMIEDNQSVSEMKVGKQLSSMMEKKGSMPF